MYDLHHNKAIIISCRMVIVKNLTFYLSVINKVVLSRLMMYKTSQPSIGAREYPELCIVNE